MNYDEKLYKVAEKWWKTWSAGPMTSDEKNEMLRDITNNRLNVNDVIFQMQIIRSNFI